MCPLYSKRCYRETTLKAKNINMNIEIEVEK